MKRTLCDYEGETVRVVVTADIKDGKLVLSGHDLGKSVEGTFGKSDYEYFYSLDSANLKRLRDSFGVESDEDILDRLESDFGGVDGCKRLREYCEANSIELKFVSF